MTNSLLAPNHGREQSIFIINICIDTLFMAEIVEVVNKCVSFTKYLFFYNKLIWYDYGKGKWYLFVLQRLFSGIVTTKCNGEEKPRQV